MIRANFTVEKAKTLALLNITDAEHMIQWNDEHGIHVLRLSSDMFPHFTDPDTEPYTMDFAKPALARLGALAREYGQRITMHPGQFNQIGSNSRRVFEKTIQDLDYHAQILDSVS